MDETSSKSEGEKILIEDNLRKEKQLKSDLESQIQTLKTALKFANEKVDNLVEELEETRRKLILSEEDRDESQKEVNETEKRLQDSKLAKEKLEKAKSQLEEALTQLKDEKIENT